MKAFTLSFLAVICTASGTSLRNDFEAELASVVDTPSSNRNLQDCVASSTYVGCYADRNLNRIMEKQIAGNGHSALMCESVCVDQGYMYFGREHKGQCFCSNQRNYMKHGAEEDCDCCGERVGSRKMCVWKSGPLAPGCDEDGQPIGSYLGCYNNRNNNRALPFQVDGMRHSADECQAACAAEGMTYYAREWKGQCFCSEDDDYDKHGMADDCDCCGSNVGSRKMCVWSV